MYIKAIEDMQKNMKNLDSIVLGPLKCTAPDI